MNTANETLATIRMFGPLGKTFGRTHQRLMRTTGRHSGLWPPRFPASKNT
jgi:hypothetical protein